MLRELSLKNAFSFKEEQTVSFTTPSSAPFLSVPSKWGDGILTVMVAVGPNASGKTNLLRGLSFLNKFISLFPKDEQGKGISLVPFAFTEESSPSEFRVEFEDVPSGRRYRYEIALTGEQVLSEYLFRRDLGGRWKRMLARERNESAPKGYDFYVHSDLKMDKRLFVETLRDDASFFIAFRLLKNTALDDFFRFMDCPDNLDARYAPGASRIYKNMLLAFLHKNERLRSDISHIIKNIGLGISDISIEKNELQKELFEKITTAVEQSGNEYTTEAIKDMAGRYTAKVFHSVNGKKYALPMEQESSGTQEFFYLITLLFLALSFGSTVIYDELEEGLHPLLLPVIISLFTDDAINLNHAQLFCTCHAIDVLKRLSKEQILLVEKNENLESRVTRLDSFTGLRRNDNYVAKYLAGEFGALPDVQQPVFPLEGWKELCADLRKGKR